MMRRGAGFLLRASLIGDDALGKGSDVVDYVITG